MFFKDAAPVGSEATAEGGLNFVTRFGLIFTTLYREEVGRRLTADFTARFAGAVGSVVPSGLPIVVG